MPEPPKNLVYKRSASRMEGRLLGWYDHSTSFIITVDWHAAEAVLNQDRTLRMDRWPGDAAMHERQ